VFPIITLHCYRVTVVLWQLCYLWSRVSS